MQEAIEWFDKAIADFEAALRETTKPIFLAHLAGTVGVLSWWTELSPRHGTADSFKMKAENVASMDERMALIDSAIAQYKVHSPF